MGAEQLKQEIREYSRILGLQTIGTNFENEIENAEGYIQYLHRLLRAEMEAYETRAVQRRINQARFPYRKYLEDLEVDCLPEGLKHRLPELMSLEFIPKGQNIIFTGNPGTGKTHTSIGLGLRALPCHRAEGMQRQKKTEGF